MNTNKNKYDILKIGVIILLIFVGTIGLTYGYFVKTVKTDGKRTKTKIVTGMLDVDFATSEYINNQNTKLVNDAAVLLDGEKSSFSVSRSTKSTVDSLYYDVYMSDIQISSSLKSPYFKWRLYDSETPSVETQPIATGTFKNIGNKTEIKMNQARIYLPEGETQHYSLYIWLSNDEENIQNELLNGTFSAKIRIEAITI